MTLMVILDLESTGLSTCNDHITQIGAVICRYKDGKYTPVEGVFETLVHTEKTISDKVASITGITNGKLIGAPSSKKAITQFFQWVQERREPMEEVCLVAYNGHSFDFPLLFNEMERYQMRISELINPTLEVRLLDPLKWARESLDTSKLLRKNTGSCSYCLGDVYLSIFKAPIEQAHTALADAVALQRLCSSEEFSGLNIGQDSRYCVLLGVFASDLNKMKRNRALVAKSVGPKSSCQKGTVSLVELASRKRSRSEGSVVNLTENVCSNQ